MQHKVRRGDHPAPKVIHWLIVAAPLVILTFYWTLLPKFLVIIGTVAIAYRQTLSYFRVNETPKPLGKFAGKKRCCVVGAGLSGLACLKELNQAGHDVVCFETKPGVGGVFSHSFWGRGSLTSSAPVTAFSDFNPPHIDHMRKEEYVDYLTSYAKHFNVFHKIKFNTAVEKMEFKHGAWKVTTSDGKTELFDHVSVAVGNHCTRNAWKPNVPGLDEFKGRVMHSSDFETNETLRGERVLCVGFGESGADISSQAADVASKAYVAIRSGAFIIPRINPLTGTSNDFDSTRLRYSLPKIVHAWCMYYCEWINGYFGNLSKEAEIRLKILKGLRDYPGQTAFTKSNLAVEQMAAGKLEVVKGIKSVTPGTKKVTMTDGKTIEVDTIIFCTGFHWNGLPFLPNDEFIGNACPSHLYLRMYHPKFADTLCFIGYSRPLVGSISTISELASRYNAQIVSGQRELPPMEVMQRQAASDRKLAEKELKFGNPGCWAGLVNWIPYMDMLASKIGCRPSPNLVFTDPNLALRVTIGPMIGAQYRLCGPGATPASAKKMMMNIPWGSSRKRDLAFFAALHLLTWFLNPFFTRSKRQQCSLF